MGITWPNPNPAPGNSSTAQQSTGTTQQSTVTTNFKSIIGVKSPATAVGGFTGSGGSNEFYPLVAWIIVIGLLFLVARTRWGYYILFMFVVTSIMLVLFVGAPTIAAILKAGQIPANQNQQNQANSGPSQIQFSQFQGVL